MRKVHVFSLNVMAAATLLAGCMAPLATFLPETEPHSGPVGFFAEERGTGAIAVRLAATGMSTQVLDAADPAYNAVRFELQNTAKLKTAKVIGVSKQANGVYSAVFTGLPSDAEARFTLKASLYKNIATPTNPLDAGYLNPDNKVGEGTSVPFSLTPGQSVPVSVTINALGAIMLTSNLFGFSDIASIFELGDTSAGFVTTLKSVSNPGATHVTYAFYPLGATSGTPIGSVQTILKETWAGSPVRSLTLPSALGAYNLVMDMYAGSTLLSRRVRPLTVAQPQPRVQVTGVYPTLDVNGEAWDLDTELETSVSVTVDPQFMQIYVTNSSAMMVWAKVGANPPQAIPPYVTMSLFAIPGTYTLTLSQVYQ